MSVAARLRHAALTVSEWWGWKRNAGAFVFGALATLALPPIDGLVFLFPAFMGLFWLLDSAPSPRRAFADGWWFGLGHFMTGLYWMCIALLTDPARFAWLIPFTLIGLNGVIAIYTGLVGWVYHKIGARGLAGVFALALLWSAAEFARGHLFTGFPWNLIGYAWSFSDAMYQSLSVMGIYTLGMLTVCFAALPAALFTEDARRASVAVVAMSVLMLGMAFAGQWRLDHTGVRMIPGVTLRLVQGNIAQDDKWNPEQRAETMQRYVSLSRRPGFEKISAVIWPETAMPYLLNEQSDWLTLLGREAVPPRGLLITGAVRSEGEPPRWQVWNSVRALNGGGEVVASYDKHKLVPFGEFVPFRGILPIEKITHGSVDFSAGPGPRDMVLPGGILPPASPLICYEVIFPDQAVQKNSRASWLLNITNDAWFGTSSGPYQHFAMARARAVEEGMPLVRVANSGISGLIDPLGRVMKKTVLNTMAVLDVPVPDRLTDGAMYNKLSGKGVVILIYASFLLIFYLHRPRKI